MNSTLEGLQQTEFVIVVTTMSYSLTAILPANIYIMWLILREDRLAPDIFYFNLSSGEILVCLSTVMYFFAYGYNCASCFEAYASLRGVFLTASPLFKCLICLECYLGVNHPVWFLRLKPLRYRLTCCALSWLLVFTSCAFDKYTYADVRHLLAFFIQNLLLLVAVLFCLVSVMRTLKRPGPGENSAQKKSNRMKRKPFKILLVTLASMAVNFLLSMVPIPMQFWLPERKFFSVYLCSTCFSFLTGFMQPLIYLQRSEKILCLRLH